jgi:prolyl-tRNA synthetase
VRWTRLLAPTLRENPAEAETASDRLLTRAGFIRRAAPGLYHWLPLGRRVLAKVEAIVREEMDARGLQEVGLPVLRPSELRQRTGSREPRREKVWPFQDSQGRNYGLGEGHEELVTDLVRGAVTSGRQLPLILYLVQVGHRDERSPRGGVVSAREFVALDAYSFDTGAAGLERAWTEMDGTCRRIFRRCGLRFRAVEAGPGTEDGEESGIREFMAVTDHPLPQGGPTRRAPASRRELFALVCEECGRACDIETAVGRPVGPGTDGGPDTYHPGAGLLPLEKRPTPGVHTIDELARFSGVPADRQIKILFYRAVHGAGGRAARETAGREPELVAALVRGDRELNEVKLRNVLGCDRVELADRDEVREKTGAPTGSAGPVGLSGARVVADEEVMLLENSVCGANEEGFHYFNVNPGRDFNPDQVADLRVARAGDPCPGCGAPMTLAGGIRIGRLSRLGTRYSRALDCTFTDADGTRRPMVMGRYSIDLTSVVAAVVEQNHDEDGIVWPMSLAPYHLVVVPVNIGDPAQREAAEATYSGLLSLGVEAALDDRDERAGVKFTDAELIGFPLRIIIGPKNLKDGSVEVVERRTKRKELVALADAPAVAAEMVRQALGPP